MDDRYAIEALARMGDDGSQWLSDRKSIYGTLARTRRFRDQARDFVARHPDAQVVNLGCGLSDYLQWIDNDQVRMLDVDLSEVMAIRREILPPRHERHVLAELDLTAPDWWERLGLPASRDAAPVFLMSEGVFMYLQPPIVNAALATFGERAPAGSVLTFDAMCWLAVGRAKHHRSVKHTEAEFGWGPRRLADLTAAHPRLTLQAAYQVMGGYSLFYKLLQSTFKALMGVPFYAVYTVEAQDAAVARAGKLAAIRLSLSNGSSDPPMNDRIDTVTALEARVGTRPEAANLKVIDHLDAHAQRWLAASPLACLGFSNADRIDVTLAGGAPGFTATVDAGSLRLPRTALDDAEPAQVHRGVGVLFLVPGLGETLRVNGIVQGVDDHHVTIAVRECYGHCAKALLRSNFWHPAAGSVPATDEGTFLSAARFMALASCDAEGQTDVSPKGDPAGWLVQRHGDGICFADRPGNRRTDSFRNFLTRPHAVALLIVPGCAQVALVQGPVQLLADPDLCAAFAVNEKTQKLVTHIAAPAVELRESAALLRAAPWTASTPSADIDPAALFAAHVKLNRTRGLGAALVRAAVSVPGLMRKGLEKDYKRNLY
ncbi:hypothetical protein AX27061_1156 [Achromobacter xylosoxidans NBRC 15126 = ATCC 27061]|nr:hypothetical protein AX27061_1156 [Achromobacter xylosoxidans NBRC 15126 = ATCC 27061]